MIEKVKEYITSKTLYLLSLDTKDKEVVGQLLGLKCVLQYIKELEKDKEKMRIK